MSEPQELLRRLPSVSRLLATDELRSLIEQWGRQPIVAEIRAVVDEHRRRILGEELSSDEATGSQPPTAAGLAPAGVAEAVLQRMLRRQQSMGLREVINGTGILLHTGLGRAPLAEPAIDAIAEIAGGYSSVEIDLDSGERGRRVRSVEGLLCELTGAEAALVVNNNAAATVLALAAMAAGREVIVSRGELIEIGGQFRLPEIMAASGAVLREVGSTNKTRIGDYAEAIQEATAAMLLVHPSNYVVVGFTEQVPLSDLVPLGQRHGVPVIHDIGSGALVDFARFGFRDEPMARRSIAQGAEVVLFSGDKLLGGPQCGIMVGRRATIEKIGRHPLARAMRVDKLTLAALAATLELYRDPERASRTIPLLRLLGTPLEELRRRASRIARELTGSAGRRDEASLLAAEELAAEELVAEGQGTVEIVDDHSYLGGGSIPTQRQPTCCVAITPSKLDLDAFARRLRTGTPAIVGRIQQGRWLLDLRTVFPDQDRRVVAALQAALQ